MCSGEEEAGLSPVLLNKNSFVKGARSQIRGPTGRLVPFEGPSHSLPVPTFSYRTGSLEGREPWDPPVSSSDTGRGAGEAGSEWDRAEPTCKRRGQAAPYPGPTLQALSLGLRLADSKGDHSSPEREHRGIWDQNVS